MKRRLASRFALSWSRHDRGRFRRHPHLRMPPTPSARRFIFRAGLWRRHLHRRRELRSLVGPLPSPRPPAGTESRCGEVLAVRRLPSFSTRQTLRRTLLRLLSKRRYQFGWSADVLHRRLRPTAVEHLRLLRSDARRPFLPDHLDSRGRLRPNRDLAKRLRLTIRSSTIRSPITAVSHKADVLITSSSQCCNPLYYACMPRNTIAALIRSLPYP